MAEEHREKISLNAEAIKDILTLRYNLSQEPILPKKTWKDFTENSNFTDDVIESKLVNYLENNIDSNSKSVSIALSGGVDSTLVIALLRNTFPEIKINALSIRFAESVDETSDARKIADHVNANHHIIELENYLEELPKAISIIKQPFWDLHWYYVVKNSVKYSSYLASGDGGDELFGGYTFRYSKFLSLINLTSKPYDKVKAYLSCHERDRVPDQEFLFDSSANFSWEKVYQKLLPYFDNPLSPIQQVFLADYNGKLLHNFSPVNSSIHDFFKIKSIAPILSNDILSYAPQIPLDLKYDKNSNIGKLPLRKILSKYKIDHLINKEKLGFNVNTINLWQSHGHKLCKKYFDNSRIVNDRWINKEWIQKYIDKTDLSVQYVNKFLGLLAFEIWYRLFVTKDISSDDKLV